MKEKCIASVQTLSGAGAITIGVEFLSQYLKVPVYVSNPSWPIHEKMAKRVGLRCEEYPYYSYELKSIDFYKMMQFLSAGENGAIIILHASAHNPTGIDLTQQQWKQLCSLCQDKQFLPFFDMAYQGFASGSLLKDCWPVRYFVEQGVQLLVGQSFAKNMGLYGERVGALHITTRSEAVAAHVLSQLK